MNVLYQPSVKHQAKHIVVVRIVVDKQLTSKAQQVEIYIALLPFLVINHWLYEQLVHQQMTQFIVMDYIVVLKLIIYMLTMEIYIVVIEVAIHI